MLNRIKNYFNPPKPLPDNIDIQVHAQAKYWSGTRLLDKLNVYSVRITEDKKVSFMYKSNSYKSASTFDLKNGDSYWFRAEATEDQPPKLWVSLPLELEQ